MEDVVIETRPSTCWQGRRVFITGHTGFKGSWLALWLADLGAEVTGAALAPPTDPSLFEHARVAELVRHRVVDIRDLRALNEAVVDCRPEVIFHLAAQPLVRLSYREPAETFATNVQGTVHLLEAVRHLRRVPAVVCITTDKCYLNREWVWPYRESDALGGHDPYSASKAAAEMVIAAYRNSFFPADRGDEHGTGIASVRAGNVIGGGDWAEDRLVPDLVRAFSQDSIPIIRSPGAIRPWQHVLEALGGYILLAEHLLAGNFALADAWNFGPAETDVRPVSWVANRISRLYGGHGWDVTTEPHLHEAHILKLDTAKARSVLGWTPRLNLDQALSLVTEWHQRVDRGEHARDVTLGQIRAYRRTDDSETAQESFHREEH